MLQMKLARTTIDACDELEEIWFGDYDTGISRGYIVSRALNDIFPDRLEMDWDDIEDYAGEHFGNSKESLHTALDLSDEDIEKLDIMQKDFMTIFGRRNIYKPFVIRMILAAELYNHMWEEVETDAKGEELKPYVLGKMGTLNIQDYIREYDKEHSWIDIEEAIERNDILALQDYIPGENCKWIDRCKDINGKKYRVITPVAWTRRQTKAPITMTVIREDIIKEYKPLRINDDTDTLATKYTYGILTFENGTKLRIMNVHIPSLLDDDAERLARSKKFWDSILGEIRVIPADEKFVLLGDFNAGKGREFMSRSYFLKLNKMLNMLDEDRDYSTFYNGGHEFRVDYIFISGKMAMEYSAITSTNSTASQMGATHHVLVEATFVSQRPYLEYCKKMLRIEDERDWEAHIVKYED